ncbi:Sugar or nucleoside kinase, ribokinase family [Consotaella salsifontis]|uniref:Sugar or nucleoside kinase, ribokinase family n=2 Tax=Consotaella salsifontis TaxID=1365950 RepID=A0A1T4LEN4_9HYPH|nr:Sugar or nucleoside kinase, ribokinase family [Consotaella salsifontis]
MVNGIRMSNAQSFLLVGAAHIDRRARSQSAFVPAASNPGHLHTAVGGAVFNAAVVLRAVGAEVAYLGARGGDADGELVESTLSEMGVRDCATTWLDRATPSYTAILDDHGDLVAGIADMALYDFLSPRFFARRHIRELIAGSNALLFDANLPSATIERLVREASGRPTAAIGVSPAKVTRLRGALPLLSAVFLSRAEAAALVDADASADVVELANALVERGIRQASISDGPRLLAILDDGVVLQQEPLVLPNVADVTGAGDTLAGAAFFWFCQGVPFKEAVRRGMAAAFVRVAGGALTAPAFSENSSAVLAEMPPARPVAR